MDFQTIEKIYGQVGKVTDLEVELNNLHNTYKSPSFQNTGNHKQNRSVTERAVNRADELKERLKRESDILDDQLKELNQWLKTVKDHEVSCLVILHCIAGRSWAITAERRYNKRQPNRARNKVKQYFEKENASQNG